MSKSLQKRPSCSSGGRNTEYARERDAPRFSPSRLIFSRDLEEMKTILKNENRWEEAKDNDDVDVEYGH